MEPERGSLNSSHLSTAMLTRQPHTGEYGRQTGRYGSHTEAHDCGVLQGGPETGDVEDVDTDPEVDSLRYLRLTVIAIAELRKIPEAVQVGERANDK